MQHDARCAYHGEVPSDQRHKRVHVRSHTRLQLQVQERVRAVQQASIRTRSNHAPHDVRVGFVAELSQMIKEQKRHRHRLGLLETQGRDGHLQAPRT